MDPVQGINLMTSRGRDCYMVYLREAIEFIELVC